FRIPTARARARAREAASVDRGPNRQILKSSDNIVGAARRSLFLVRSRDSQMLTARGETPAAFGRRCIPAGCVAPRSNTPGILARRALPSGRIAALGATLDFHHGLLSLDELRRHMCEQLDAVRGDEHVV